MKACFDEDYRRIQKSNKELLSEKKVEDGKFLQKVRFYYL